MLIQITKKVSVEIRIKIKIQRIIITGKRLLFQNSIGIATSFFPNLADEVTEQKKANENIQIENAVV